MLLEISLVFVVLLLVWIIITFRRWKKSLLNALYSNSEIATTSVGEIEYVLEGSGPVILMLHGSPGGYDQGLLYKDLLINEGFSLLSISRPGYLRTPLTTGETFEEQADAIEALLVTLGISKVAILGVSGGGPIALHFALRHPDRLWALLLMAAVSNEYSVTQEQMDSLLARLFLSGSMADFGAWIYDILTRRSTAWSLKEALKETMIVDPEERDTYVKQVMDFPEQVDWLKRFVRTTCPMSPRMIGLNNDIKLLQQVSFTNLEDIKCPTLVIHGTVDGDVSFSNAEFAASSIPNAKLYAIENIGHIAWLGEHVPEMNSELIRFLKEHS
ncbi:MAG: alpha/beta fold hydrolase [Candidatus Thorarchaeota archaeon]|jgi:pimeloyl-ACP methyl ester carboxylesterase